MLHTEAKNMGGLLGFYTQFLLALDHTLLVQSLFLCFCLCFNRVYAMMFPLKTQKDRVWKDSRK
jgi:hypothetical protein